MTKIETPKIPDDLIVGAAMAMYAHANEVGEIDTSKANGLTVLPSGDLTRLSMDDIERIGFEEEMARDRATALARAAIKGITVDEITGDGEPRRSILNRLKKIENPYVLLTEEDFLPGGRIDTVKSVGRISRMKNSP